MLQRKAAHLVVVDALILLGDAVGEDVEVLAGQVHGGAVRQVAAVGEVHAQDRVAGLEQAEVHRDVRLRAGVRLHVACSAPKSSHARSRARFSTMSTYWHPP